MKLNLSVLSKLFYFGCIFELPDNFETLLIFFFISSLDKLKSELGGWEPENLSK